MTPIKVINVSSLTMEGNQALRYFWICCMFFCVPNCKTFKLLMSKWLTNTCWPCMYFIFHFYWRKLVARTYFLVDAYAPRTKEGNIVVDRVLASCYADVSHEVVHFAMMPIQWFAAAIEQMFGCDIGFPVYVNIARELSTILLSDGQFYSY